MYSNFNTENLLVFANKANAILHFGFVAKQIDWH